MFLAVRAILALLFIGQTMAQAPSSASAVGNGLVANPSIHSLLQADLHDQKAMAPPPASTRRVNPYPIPKWAQVSHIEGKGVGYDMGYTKLDLVLGPEYQIGSFLPLVQLDGLFFNDGKFAGTVGFLGRYLPESFCGIFSADIFYDYRRGHFGNFQQVSTAFELLSRRWELRALASFVVGPKLRSRTYHFDHYDGPFFAQSKQNDVGLNHVEANAGYYLIYGKYFQVYASAGPYYFWGKFDTSVWGGRAFIRPQYRDIISVELSVSHDRLYETIYQVNVVLSLPLYNFSSALKRKKGPCGIPNRQIYQPLDPMIPLRCQCCWKANFD